jgi:hypothetical protein
MDVLESLLRSRKFVAALIAMAVSILVAFGVDEAVASQLITAIAAIAVAYIGGTAWEDASMKARVQFLQDEDGDEE